MRTVLHDTDIARALTRISHEIVEGNRGTADLVILGIPTRGALLADRLAALVGAIEKNAIEKNAIENGAIENGAIENGAGETREPGGIASGRLDVTMYRDDLSSQPMRTPGTTRMPASGIDGKTVVLVDDVLYSGRTVRAALDALADLGRPRAVRLAVLVDRGHRELPIRADYVGKNLPSAASERINVRLVEVDGVDEVAIDA